MNQNSDNTLCGRLVYICGKSKTTNSTIAATLKEKLTVDLASRCFVRTHASPVEDLVETYYAIVAAHAFVFTLNSQSITDIDCLNQLGVAVSYNIPVVAVREAGYSLPKALPARFYQTKIVQKKSQLQTNNKGKNGSSPVNENTTPDTLASALTSCYENSVGFTPGTYVKFFDQLLNCLTTLHSYQSPGNVSESSMSEEEESAVAGEKYDEKTSALIQITGVETKKTPRKKRSPQIRKAKMLNDTYGVEPKKLLKRQQVITGASYKKISASISKVTPVMPSNSKPLSPRKSKSPPRQTPGVNANRNSNHNNSKADSPNVTTNGDIKDKDQDNGLKIHVKQTINIHHVSSPPLEKQPVMKEAENIENSSKIELSLPNSGRSRRTLRRFSSLPVVPTQYLVASDSSTGSPQVHTYPPTSSSSHLSPGADSPILFSGDESDYGALQLSRTCSPLEHSENFLRYFSTDETSR